MILLKLKLGIKLCTYNISETIVNGSKIVVDIGEYPIVKFVNNNTVEMRPIDLFDDNIPGLIFKKGSIKICMGTNNS